MKHFVYPHGREDRDGHMHRRARIASFVNPMEHGESAVAGRIQSQWWHLGRPDIKDHESTETESDHPENVYRERGIRALQPWPESDVDPQRDVGRQCLGLERNHEIKLGRRHDGRHVRRIPLHIKVADEEKPGEKGRTGYRQGEASTGSSAQLDVPWTPKAGRRVTIAGVA